MKTLYDLLGALPDDDAEGLRAAFRKAVKGAHPDIRKGDPDAALRFREIVRANEILGDPEQRQAYDYLLELAHLDQAEPASPHALSPDALAITIHKLASGVIALSGAAVAIVGGYLLFMSISSTSLVSANATSLQGAETFARQDRDVIGPVANFDRAFQFDPKALPAYVDLDFYRHRKIHGAFPEVAPTRANRLKPALTVTRKQPRPSVTSPAQQQTAAQILSRPQAVAQMR